MSNADDGKTPHDDFELSLDDMLAEETPAEPKATPEAEAAPAASSEVSAENVAETPVEATADFVLDEPIVETELTSADDLQLPSEEPIVVSEASPADNLQLASEETIVETPAAADDLQLPAETPLVESEAALADDLLLPDGTASGEPLVESTSTSMEEPGLPVEPLAETADMAMGLPPTEATDSATTEATTAPAETEAESPAEEEAGPPKEGIFTRLAQADPYTVMLGISAAAVFLAVAFLFLEWANFGFDIKATAGRAGL